MARSRLSYAQAVKLLTGDDRIALLGKIAGGALLLTTPFANVALQLFDAKGEANALLRDLVGGSPRRIRSSQGKRHYELLEAAHTVLVLSAFFDALAEEAGEQFAALELTDDEKRRLGTGVKHPLRDHFTEPAAPMPGPLCGFAENLPAVNEALHRTFSAFVGFAAGLAAAEHQRLPEPQRVVDHALALYTERYARLAADIPEFGIWSQLDEHAATRAEVRKQTETLVHLNDLLSETVRSVNTPAVEAEQRLARQAAQVLQRPLWRSNVPAPASLHFPTVEQGFISPRFRIAVSDKGSRLADESWWSRQPERHDLAAFLAGYLSDPASTQRPLVILGHPGAGKSLLTEVLAARLPTNAFTTIRVPLRRVDPDAEIHQQVEATVESAVKERISWGDLCRISSTTKVVLLDGFDELVQATGVAQSHYIDLAASFQQEEWVNDRPVVVVITSRTLVMDRTAPPDGTVVVKLEPFDIDQISRWVDAWNTANAANPTFRPLTADELYRHQALASQPLLLLMLAVYAAESGIARLDAEDLSTDLLYRRLLDSFIRRQVREKSGTDLGETKFRQLEAESRRDLAAAAFAMFNRGQQYVSEDSFDRDLDALHPGEAPAGTRLGEPLTRARRTVAAFFFVHVAQTDDDTRGPGRRTYEFLHATFAEYLVAEHTVELLTDLADDWARSRKRTYGANFNDHVLRALLSHQPLTNGEQVTPFLISLIDKLPEETRHNLREALLELFRGARKRIQDDDYRPTPFDAVHRLAAYTANLVVLAALCEPDGIGVDDLCGHPDAPGIETTVRLWRSGLDTEAQNSLFSRLLRDGDRLTARGVEPRSLPVCEAQLIGDTFTEAVLLTGRRIWSRDPKGTDVGYITPFQRDFSDRVVRLLISRWPALQLGRLMPFDERMYLDLAESLEARADHTAPSSGYLLARCLIDDGSYLPLDLVDRLIRLLITKTDGVTPFTLPMLALRWPKLLVQYPEIYRRRLMGFATALLYEAGRATRHESPETFDPVLEDLRTELAASSSDSVSAGTVTPSMVTGLASAAPHLLPAVLQALASYGELAWSQVTPRQLLHAVEVMERQSLSTVKPIEAAELHTTVESVRSYVSCQDGKRLDVEHVAALEQLRAWINARIGTTDEAGMGETGVPSH